MSVRWRLLLDGPSEGAWNMAVDRAILDAHEAGHVPPTLRLYLWERPTVSLGRFQDLATVDVDYCRARGIALVRRPTGGHGVLHDHEVTYSIVAGVRDGVPKGVQTSYRVLCGALVEAFRMLGVGAQLTSRPRGDGATGACYLHATSADLSLGMAKLSGSAQMWDRDSCLQHGSFVITRDMQCESSVFRLDDRDARALARTTATLTDALSEALTLDETLTRVMEGLSAGLASVLDARTELGALSAAEHKVAAETTQRYRLGTT